MRVWISCTVVGLVACSAGAFAYGCGVSAFETCAENGTCVGDGGPDSSMQDGSMGNDASDGGGGNDVVGSDVTGDVHPGEAGCPSPTTLDCNGTCVDPTQPAHCGTCNTVCEGGTPECSGGMCSSGCSGTTPTNCSGSCVNEQTDPQHCGGCTNVCPGPDGGTGTATCEDAGCGYACSADAGTPLNCGSLCVNPTTDPNNCGGCGAQCGIVANGSPACVAGSDGGPTCGASCAPGSGYHGAGPGCDSTCLPNTDDPSTDPCVVANAYGTFVSPSGADTTGCGTMASPCLTIANATTVAKAATKRVYACGTFITPQAVTAAGDGVTVYGGFDCTGWAYSASTPTTVAPGSPGVALTVTGTTTGVTFEHFVFTAESAPQVVASNTAAQSSVAIFANGAVLTLTDVAVNAGSGQPGAAGATPSNYGTPSTPVVGSLSGAAAGGSVTCADGSTSAGGAGGVWSPTDTGAPAQAGLENGTAVSNNYGFNGPSSCVGGGGGNDGAGVTTLGSGQTSSGSVSSSGWTVGAAGTAGENGGPAQGVGGGGADDSTVTGMAGGGGGGGAGGCGGAGGLGGHTGGSSIGILSFQSNVSTTATTITTEGGGTGGAGGPGQGGQGAQTGAKNTNGGCSGGDGGSGGQGAGGGGGAGGLSSGIVWSGSASQEPSFNGMTYTTQAAPVLGITLGAQGTSNGNGATPTADAILQN
jgi:hypothetical protein